LISFRKRGLITKRDAFEKVGNIMERTDIIRPDLKRCQTASAVHALLLIPIFNISIFRTISLIVSFVPLC